MALANVAVLLAKWGYSVLAVDWDLEAPGLEQFFSKLKPEIRKLRKETPGIVDMVRASTNGAGLNWRDCLRDITINGGKGHLSVLSAGRNDGRTPRSCNRSTSRNFSTSMASVPTLRRSGMNGSRNSTSC
jgi:MinD-like ATPase involved in chromosome partitioning or flagellar assembly